MDAFIIIHIIIFSILPFIICYLAFSKIYQCCYYIDYKKKVKDLNCVSCGKKHHISNIYYGNYHECACHECIYKNNGQIPALEQDYDDDVKICSTIDKLLLYILIPFYSIVLLFDISGIIYGLLKNNDVVVSFSVINIIILIPIITLSCYKVKFVL
ncbi:hypothetical protein Catovirus_1_416 [Catovirus CTV1]|uniref:Uncharacterized protein n=1 Tax=Catovirus CTV1 TaxID=1977631 RepID=A0A1V0S9H5_9VIRU|nr:hypothetical protein Catovirus_1_416 [Catovirus CTV1]